MELFGGHALRRAHAHGDVSDELTDSRDGLCRCAVFRGERLPQRIDKRGADDDAIGLTRDRFGRRGILQNVLCAAK